MPRSLAVSEVISEPSAVVRTGRGVVLLSCEEKWMSSALFSLRRNLLLAPFKLSLLMNTLQGRSHGSTRPVHSKFRDSMGNVPGDHGDQDQTIIMCNRNDIFNEMSWIQMLRHLKS